MILSSIVAIGTSTGGVGALQALAAGLDPSLPAAWCMVLHIDGHHSAMPDLLSRAGRMPAQTVRHGERLEAGRIYLPPPDLHFVVHDAHGFLSRGPRENWARPAIDPLFRSVAETYGPRAIGVILTGSLNDGTAGLMAIKRAGGVAVVQDPRDAASAQMPRSALRHVDVDHCVPLAEMPALLSRLVLRNADAAGPPAAVGGGYD